MKRYVRLSKHKLMCCNSHILKRHSWKWQNYWEETKQEFEETDDKDTDHECLAVWARDINHEKEDIFDNNTAHYLNLHHQVQISIADKLSISYSPRAASQQMLGWYFGANVMWTEGIQKAQKNFTLAPYGKLLLTCGMELTMKMHGLLWMIGDGLNGNSKLLR